MLKKSSRLAVARITLMLMLFTQGVMAWAACDLSDRSPDRAVIAAAEVAPCHESGFGAACLTHCLADRQAVQKVTNDVPALPTTPVLVIAAIAQTYVQSATEPISGSPSCTGPPRRILLQSFQI